jgi:hypothetical protein
MPHVVNDASHLQHLFTGLRHHPKSGSWLNLRPVIYDGGQPTVGIHAGWMRSGGKS